MLPPYPLLISLLPKRSVRYIGNVRTYKDSVTLSINYNTDTCRVFVLPKLYRHGVGFRVLSQDALHTTSQHPGSGQIW